MLLPRLHNLLTAHASAGPLASDSTVVWLDRTRVHVDVEQFLTDAAAAVAAHAAGQPDAATQLTAALAAYTGDFLQGEIPQHWAISLAQEVRTTHRGLLRALATALLH